MDIIAYASRMAKASLTDESNDDYLASNNDHDVQEAAELSSASSNMDGESQPEEVFSDGASASSNRVHRHSSSDIMLSIRSMMDRMDEVVTKSSPHQNRRWKERWQPWESWSLFRSRSTALGCLSSIAVLVIRLFLDIDPLAYFIHSIIVFLDMILIHLFTNSPWLSISGEMVTIVSFLAFHYTKETVFELLETTAIAILCSFHLIASRNKHMEREKQLRCQVKHFHQESMRIVEGTSHIDLEKAEDLDLEESEDANRQKSQKDERAVVEVDESWYSRHSEQQKERLLGCGKQFFEHFLDGSAGVMYTSFLGLIITELITYGENKTK